MEKKKHSNVQGGRPCRLAITAEGKSKDAPILPIGRSSFFIVFEGDPEKFSVLKNEAMGMGSESGMESARFLARKGVDVVVTGTLGPGAYEVLETAGIQVHAGCSGTVSEAITNCLKGKLPVCKGATYSGYLGI